MKKLIFGGLVLFFLIITISYKKPVQVNDLIKPYSLEILPDRMRTSIYFSAHSNKEFEVTNDKSKKEIINLLSNMTVKKILITPKTYAPKLKETYQIYLNNEYSEISNSDIYILNNKYIKINDKLYKILFNPDLTSIYDSIILDQPKGLIDEFYYDLIH